MKLLRCYVENFGKISKKEFQFKNNLTIFKEENGWGKTTLSVFIKSMLYGFDKTSKDKDERKKYKPWNNGKYGGNLDLEIKGKIYRIERFFGETPKGDKFTLIDMETNKEVNTYTEKIGEEIFKLDKESFEKSIYIPQQGIEVKISNDLTTKLTNLDTIQDDMDKYEEAQKILNKKIEDLKKKIKAIDSETKETEEKIEKCKEAQNNFEKYEKEYKDLQLEQENKKQEIEQLEKKLKKFNEQQLKEEIRKRYTKIEEDEKNATQEYEKVKEFFKGKLPSQEEISEIENKIILISKAEEEEKEVGSNYYNLKLEEIEEKQQIYDSYKETEQKIQEIEKNKKIKEYELNNTTNNKTYNIISIFIILLGIFSLIFIKTKIVGAIILVIGVAFWFVESRILGKNKKIKEAKKEAQNYEEQLEKSKQENEIKKVQLLEYIQKYGENYDENAIYEALLKIKLNFEKFKKSQLIIEETKPQIQKFLYNYFNEITREYSKYLEQIKINLINIKMLENKYNEAIKNKQEFLKEYNVAELENIEFAEESANDIDEKIKQIKNSLEIVVQNMVFYSKKMDEFSTVVDEKSELEIDLEHNNEEKEQLEKRKNIIDKTIEILEKTKEKLSTKYLKGMNENLNKYIKLLAQNTNIVDKTSIDIDLNTNIEVDGEKKNLKTFSTGYKDLIGICLRLALIDSIFKEEKPFLILDDPFVNLDEGKINNAIKLIQEISKECQIIYFVCHNSRTNRRILIFSYYITKRSENHSF